VTRLHTIQTLGGPRVDPLDLRGDDIRVRDVAHSLALQCRFTGHCLTFYSVAEHSVRVARYLEAGAYCDDVRRWGLLHDGAEAYLRDIPSPLKSLPAFAAYRRAEERAQRAMARRFDLVWPMPKSVHLADKRLLATEARDLMAPPTEPWAAMPTPLVVRIEPWTWRNAEHQFLAECRRLGIQ
jgi:hypothetical protein